MAAKTLGTILIVIVCIFLFPVTFAILGGIFGIVAGALGAVFGAVFGVFGAIFGGIFGFFGWLFDGLFDWNCDYGFFDVNIFAIAALILVVILLSRNRRPR